MYASNYFSHPNFKFPNSIFNINRQYVPALLAAMGTERQDEMAEQLVGADYALYLILAVEAAQQLADELAPITSKWSLPRSHPLSMDLSLCSIDCAEQCYLKHEHWLTFWFYSEEGPENWMDGYSDQFYDLTVEIDFDQLTIRRLSGPSR
ncbi:hypothetical protein [Paenibacillus dauci]|uniref:hypothetical protein n=1 Tax=Paenibacillus dauci TaxID=1567106 RepID=UPI000619C5B7|nr:hypothetical protein [Paenibacillus dauci]